MKIPGLEAFCVKVASAVEGRCIRFPGGAKFCIPNVGAGSPIAQLRMMLALLALALVPLAPFFTVLNILKAIKDVFDALPGIAIDPGKVIEAIGKFLKAFGALAQLFPQIAVPIMVKDILAMVAFALRTIADELSVFVDAQQAISEAADLAASTGLAALTVEVSCAQDSFDLELANQNAALGPLALLLEAVNVLLGLAGLEEIAVDLSGGEGPSEAIDKMLEIAGVLEQAASAIPV